MERETVVWALVFALPVGVGITGFSADVIGRGVFDPVAVVVGAATGLVVFAVVAFAGSVGSADESRRRDEPG